MLKEYNDLPMPCQQLSDTEIRQYLRYFHWFIDCGSRASFRPVGELAQHLERLAQEDEHGQPPPLT